MPRLLVISPVRDEAAHVPRLVRAMAAQTRRPDLWLVVDDGSRDATLALLEAAAAVHGFLRVLRAPRDQREEDNEARLVRAAEARAFNWGLHRIDIADFTHVAKLDGDIEPPVDYYERVLAEFARDPSLGVTGGWFAEPTRHGWSPVRVPHTHVPGALKVYAVGCLSAIGGVREHLGWDTIDESTARMHGFATRSLPDLVARHHRPMGSVGGRLRGRMRYGICAYHAGYPAWWVCARALKVGLLSPPLLSGGAFLHGYARAALRAPTRADPDLRRLVRAELRARLVARLRRSSRSPMR